MTDALNRQVGGDHYKHCKIQPAVFWQANDWDGAACMILKYLARHERKQGLEDVQKAGHFVELRQQLKHHLRPSSPMQVITMRTFIDENAITDPADVEALMQLERYVHAGPTWRDAEAAKLAQDIQAIATARYCGA